MNDKKKYFHYLPGYNFRITNLQSAIGITQLDDIKSFIKKEKYIEDYYKRVW